MSIEIIIVTIMDSIFYFRVQRRRVRPIHFLVRRGNTFTSLYDSLMYLQLYAVMVRGADALIETWSLLTFVDRPNKNKKDLLIFRIWVTRVTRFLVYGTTGKIA